jgi:3-carboxy-cis,cis-muconate cycloisomerase
VILAAHTAAPGLAATLLTAASSGLQRPVGLWQAEWLALPQLFGLASGALREARSIAEGLVIDAKRMRANLELTRGLIFAEAASTALAGQKSRSAAQAIVGKATEAVRRDGVTLREALAAEGIAPEVLAGVFDLKPATDAAAAVADRAIEEARAMRRILRRA